MTGSPIQRAGAQPSVVIAIVLGRQVTVASTAANEREQRVLDAYIAKSPGLRRLVDEAVRLTRGGDR